MKNPAETLARLRRLPALPPSSARELARLRALAADSSEPTPDADSPEITDDLHQVNPPLVIAGRHADWFSRHGGTRALNQALRSWIRTHQHPAGRTRRPA